MLGKVDWAGSLPKQASRRVSKEVNTQGMMQLGDEVLESSEDHIIVPSLKCLHLDASHSNARYNY